MADQIQQEQKDRSLRRVGLGITDVSDEQTLREYINQLERKVSNEPERRTDSRD